MFRYYLKIAFRNIRTNKKFSIINIAGFAFAISICLAISLFLIKEHSYDRYNKNFDQIVRLIDTKNNSSQIDYRVKDLLLNNYPEIENGCLVQCIYFPKEIKSGENGFYLKDIMSVDNSFFKVFSTTFLAGNPSRPFSDIQSAVITQSVAKTIFGTENPIGKDILISGSFPVTVTGVIKDFPENSSISAGLLVNAENENFKFRKDIGNSNDLSTYRWPFQIYLLLNSKSDPGQFITKLNTQIGLLKPYCEKVGLLRLKDIYLFDATTDSGTKQGNAGLLNLLTGISLIILILAVINYINMTVAQQNRRNKITGIKKAIGANRKSILLQFLTESITVTFLAFILGLFLVWLLIPFYNKVFNTTIYLSHFTQFPYLPILAGVVLIIGLISGSGPALTTSGINPVDVLNGSKILTGKRNYFRNSLTIFQFTISIILIFCVIIVLKQMYYVKHRNPGFNENMLLRLDIPRIQTEDLNKSIALLDELRKSPFIKNLSVTTGVPGEIRMSMGSNIENSDKNMSVPCILADTAFLETLGLKVIKGRGPKLASDYGKVCLINEAAYKQFGFENLDNKRFNNFGGYDIIGVVNDFQYGSLHKTIGPVCIMFTPVGRPTSINIRFVVNRAGLGMDIIKDIWHKELPGYPIKYQFYDEWFNSMYQSEDRFSRTIGLFAALAITISCIGILGLSIFSSEQRTKEIGIRKINGARITEILFMLNKDFIVLVGIAFLIATPIEWYLMHRWLQTFAYRTEISWWIFVLSGLTALMIALLTVSWQSWMAATRNPVEALRYE
jgi:putative ABC transport system permease protein